MSKYFFLLLLELNTSRIYCCESTTNWSSSAALSIGCGECSRTRFKFSGSSRRRRPDCFVESRRLRALGSRTSTRVCHCIGELHKTDRHIGTRSLKRTDLADLVAALRNESGLGETYRWVRPSFCRWRSDSSSFWHLCHRPCHHQDCWAQHSRHFRLEVISAKKSSVSGCEEDSPSRHQWPSTNSTSAKLSRLSSFVASSWWPKTLFLWLCHRQGLRRHLVVSTWCAQRILRCFKSKKTVPCRQRVVKGHRDKELFFPRLGSGRRLLLYLQMMIGYCGVAPLVELCCGRRVLVWTDYSAMKLTRQCLDWWFVWSCWRDLRPKRVYC